MDTKQETQVCKVCGRELPLSRFCKSHLGVFKTCKECVQKKHVQTLADKKMARLKKDEVATARNMRLSEFEPRELMAELKRRGYEFTMKYTKVLIVDSKDIEI